MTMSSASRIVIASVAMVAAACTDPRPPLDGDTGIHPPGIDDERSEDFHGRELERRGWDLALCATCHGADYGGTSAAPSCNGCHVRGPTACDTCHPARPTTGAHTTHLAREVACATCHVVPTAWDDEGHLRRDGAGDPAPAEVAMSGPAAVTVEPGDRSGPPTYDPATGTCAQVYCHGDVLGNAGGSTTKPRWTDTTPTQCSSCHGAPPPSHARSRCAECHPSGARHIDGVLDVGDGTPGCGGCHGGAQSPAPPRDLDGDVFTTALGVGAHQAHLTAPSRLSAPIPCAACHVVPTTVGAAGHIDTAGPAEVVAALGWDRTTATCGTAWCHKAAQPVWTRTGEAACGTCHGVPPANANHIPSFTLRDCVLCHPNTVDGFGNIKFVAGPSGPTTAHLDGDVDAP